MCHLYHTVSVVTHPHMGYNHCMDTPTNKGPEMGLDGLEDAFPGANITPQMPVSPGRPAFDKTSLSEFAMLPLEKQKGRLRESWAEAAFVMVERAKRFAMTATKGDFGRLQQMVTSAGIATDKVIPKGEQPMATNMVINLFGGIGAEKMLKVVQPHIPTIDVTPKAD